MALEDMAAMRAVHGSTVLHPSDANQTVQLVAEMADRPGISYLRTLRGATEVRTPPDEPVHIGGSRIAFGAGATDAAVLACGITVPEAVTAAGRLAAEGVRVRVVDCYSVKPLDTDAVVAAADECDILVTVEDHWPEGGLGEAVLAGLADAGRQATVRRLAVRGMPESGTPAELMHAAGIDADAIVAALRAR
jgi:transketolase